MTPPTEVVGRALPDTGWDTFVAADIARFASLVVGPGLGRGDDIGAEVRALLAVAPIPAVIDGDGLLAAIDPTGGYSVLHGRTAPTILTPHDGEFAMLGGDVDNHLVTTGCGGERVERGRRGVLVGHGGQSP